MAGTLLRAWWARLRGRLDPTPCPFSMAGVLDTPGRRLVAGPARVLDAFAIAAGEKVLEIGPGSGFYSLEAGRRVAPGGRLLGLDVQHEMLAATCERMRAAGLAASFVRADARLLPMRSATLDLVFLVSVLGEIPDRRQALAEIRRVLRPGGRLALSEQFPDPDFVFPGTLRRELREAGFTELRTRGWLFYTSVWSRPPSPPEARQSSIRNPLPNPQSTIPNPQS